MKKQLWIYVISLAACSHAFAASPTLKYISQPVGGAFSLPINLVVQNLAPIPQALCSPTLSTATEAATCSGLPLCPNSKSKTASFSCSVTTSCSGTVSGNNATCTLYLNVIKPSTLAAATKFTFTTSYGTYATPLASNAFIINGISPLPPASSYRTVTFTNSCNYPVWFGSITGAAPSQTILTGGSIDCTGGNPGKQACIAAGGACYSRTAAADACYSQMCTSDSDCMTGASCYAATGKCYWDNPVPTNQNFELTNGQTNTFSIPEYTSNNIGIVWSGAFGGRTSCTSGACTSALCTQGTESAEGVCSLGTGFQQPATQAEVTFLTYATVSSPTPTDAYDVEVINGANLPISMYPTGTALPASGNPYVCGAPGYNQNVPATSPAGATIGASSWNVSASAPNLAYRYVLPSTSPATQCSSDGDCSSGQYCGLSYPSISGSGNLVCGVFAGWFTADQVCGTNGKFTNVYNKSGASVYNFSCTSTPTGIVSGNTMSNLYQCNVGYATSCYSSPTTSDCCGCVDWNTQGILLPTASNSPGYYVEACNNKNTIWTGNNFTSAQPEVFDTIYFLKATCPSSYTYPFDDKSSSFTCSNIVSSVNTQAYTIEFCPGGAGNSGFQP